MSELSIVFSQEPFSLLDSAGRAVFERNVKIISSKKGVKFMKEGDKGDFVYFLLSGAASVLVKTPKGPLPISHLYPPDIFGEIAVLDELVSGSKRTATIENLTDVTAAAMSPESFKELCLNNPAVLKSLGKIYQERMNELDKLKKRIKNL